VRQWVSWDAGALSLMAAAGAAAVHTQIRDELRRDGLESCLAKCMADQKLEGLNAEAVLSVIEVLKGDESCPAHAAARARAVGAGLEEEERQAAERETAILAATRRPDAPPFVDEDAVWNMRADRAQKEIAEVEEAQGSEIDFGGRLKLEEIAKMMPGASSGQAYPGATLTRLENMGSNDPTTETSHTRIFSTSATTTATSSSSAATANVTVAMQDPPPLVAADGLEALD